jgi:CHAT domain-containing protein/tetratricopeptide (TPR) repeat protein
MFQDKLVYAVIFLLLPFLYNDDGIKTSNNFNNDTVNPVIEKINDTIWDTKLLDEISFYIVNSEEEAGVINKIIAKVRQGPEKTFLFSLLLKKEGDYSSMFDSLYTLLNDFPPYYAYYNELVFAANSSGRLDLVDESLEALKVNNPFKIYLASLLNSERGHFSKSLELLNELKSFDSTNSDILYQAAMIYRNLGNYKESAAVLNRIEINKNDLRLQAKVSLALGALYFLSGEYSNSDKFYSAALKNAISSGDKFNTARAYLNIGINEDVKGNTDKAREYFVKAYNISSAIRENEITANALSETGVSYTYSYDLINAKKNYLESYKLYKRTGNRIRLSLLSENIGKIYSQFHDYSTAEKYFEEGIRYAGENKRALYLNITGLADVHNNLSNYSRALKLYREAENIANEIQDASLKGETKLGMGILYNNIGRYKNAIGYYSEAVKYFNEIENKWYSADLFHKTGLAYLNSDSLELADKYLSLAVKTAAETGDNYLSAAALIDYADLQLERNNYDKAFLLLSEAEKLSEKNNFENLLAELNLSGGKIYTAQNNFFKAAEKYKTAYELSRRISNYSLITESLYQLGELYRENNFDELAENYYKLALAETENKGRPLFTDQEVQISYFNIHKELYNSLSSFYLSQKRYTEAFEILDRGLSRNTMQNLGNLKLKSIIKQDSLLELLHEYDWMLHSGIYEGEELDSITVLNNELKIYLSANFPSTDLYIPGNRNFSVGEIRKKLNNKEYIIFLHPAGAMTYIFRLSKNGFEVFEENISAPEITKMISAISPYYSAGSIGDYYNQDLFAFDASASNKLYNSLLKKSLGGIPDNSNIIFVPCTEMLLVPFEFLITDIKDNESPYNYNDKKFLINRYNISYSPSVSVYLTQKQNKNENEEKFLLVGNPHIDNASDIVSDRRSLFGEEINFSIQPLKYSAEEISEIGSILRTNRILTERNATETNFRESAENSRIIHISTHSFLMNKQPVIFFSNSSDTENDGFLEASEVIQMNLNTDLVVLSSCNSGGGRIDEAEGIIGMTKAFFEAGTKSIIVSLWEVNDKYTSAFMKLFYNHLSKGITKTEALRNAKIDFIKEHSSNPYYWSAFVLAGDPSGIQFKAGSDLSSFIIPGIILLASLSLFAYYISRRNRTINSRA